MTEEDRQVQEIVILLTKRGEGGTPVRKLAIEHKLAEYPRELVLRAVEEMAGPGPEPQSLDEQEDFVLLWQEQLLSARSELTAVIKTQETFKAGLQILAQKAPDLVGDLPMSQIKEIDANIASANEAINEVKAEERRLAELRTKFKDWKKWQAEGTAIGGHELKEQSDALARMVDTVLPGLMEKMKAADKSAVDIQIAIVQYMTDVARETASRLQMESEKGWGPTYQTVKRYSDYLIGGFGSFLSTVTFDYVPKSTVSVLSTAVQSVVNIGKEVHVRRNAGTVTSGLDELLADLGPLAVYRANLIKYKDWCGAGLDLGGVSGLIPVVGDVVARSFEIAKATLEGFLDGQLDLVQRKDDELKEAYQKLKASGSASDEEVRKLRDKLVRDTETVWSGLTDQAQKFQDDWIKTAGEVFNKTLEEGFKAYSENSKESVLTGLGSGISGAGGGLTGSLTDKAIDAAVGVITRIVSGLFPARTPRAIFDFEVKDQVKTLVVVENTDFTEEEKRELEALSS